MGADFRTLIKLPKSNFSITHKDGLFLTGSCFAQNIGLLLESYKFNALSNPLGISYNPISIHELMMTEGVDEQKVLEKDGIYFHHLYHSSFNASSKDNLVKTVELQHTLQKQHLQNSKTLIITYGTAWVYELQQTDAIVNNCHKEPNHKFNKRLLGVEEISFSWNKLFEQLEQNYSIEQIIFTVSPVRHLKDGIRENQVSKSTLHLAIEKICSKHSKCSYFPTYEIMLDDLRDYRFYKDDLLHPNQLAINYIWDCFSKSYFSATSTAINQEIEKIRNALAHKAFQPKSLKHQDFLQKLKGKIETFQALHALNFEEELSLLNQKIL